MMKVIRLLPVALMHCMCDAAPHTTATSGAGVNEACPALSSGLGPSNSVLPDPFTFQSGDKVASKADWACRQAEISAQLQEVELGIMPPKPSSVTASYSGNNLTINASEGDKSISFSVSVSKPSGDDLPAIIYFGAPSIPIPSTVAGIAFYNDEIAQPVGGSSHPEGKFYDLYGRNHSAGSLVAWAWAVSRIIDGLELTRSQTGIDPSRVGVTGCSRNGKGAMVAGAFDPRIALTLPQESGTGGAGCWRIADWESRFGYRLDDLGDIVRDNGWFRESFSQYVGKFDTLPFDHHLLAGLIAPRPVYFMENPIEWLGPRSTYGCMGAARKQWQALGALDTFGYSQVGGHSHCNFPGAQEGEVTAFIETFLLGKNGTQSTNVFKTDQDYDFSLSNWSPWPVPTLA